MRTLLKKTILNCENYKKEPNQSNKDLVQTSLNETYRIIDKAVKKNVLHKNNGANKKSRLNNLVKSALNN